MTHHLASEQASRTHLTLQIKSLQEAQVPDGLWQGLQMVLLHIQDLTEEEKQQVDADSVYSHLLPV